MSRIHTFGRYVIPRRGLLALACACACVALTVTLLIVVVGPSGRRPTLRTLSARSSPLSPCGRGVPAAKCNPALYSPPASTGPTGTLPSRPTANLWPSPLTVPCGSTFFTSSTEQQLTAHYGLLQCFRFSGTHTWVVFGDGMSTTSTAAPPAGTTGGAIVAVDACNSSTGTCIDSAAPHDFSSFTVFYPPNPHPGRADLEATFGGRLLYISDGKCGLFTFDLATLRWYGHGQSDIDRLMSGTSAPPPVPAPPPISGPTALAQLAPPSTSGCQSP